jgi:lipopolysaccharide export LptBFGC system permease protein LptF
VPDFILSTAGEQTWIENFPNEKKARKAVAYRGYELTSIVLATAEAKERQFKNPGLGSASFAISLIAGVLVVLGLSGAANFQNTRASENILIFGFMVGGVGFALCVASLFQKEKKKLFPILGMIVTSPVILFAVSVFLLGASHP